MSSLFHSITPPTHHVLMRHAFLLTLTAFIAAPVLAQEPSGLYGIDDEDYWSNRCQILMTVDALDTARTACEQALGLEPDDEALWLTYAMLLQRLDQPTEALVAISTAITEGADDSPSYLTQCQIQVDLAQYEAAHSSCRLALERDRHWGPFHRDDAWDYHGLALAVMEQWEAAIASYNHVIHQDPSRSGFRARRCEALNHLGRHREALINCDSALRYDQGWGMVSPEVALHQRAIALAQINEPEQAIAAYDRTLTANNTGFNLWLEQGLLLADHQRNEDSLHAFEQAVRLNPESSMAQVFRCEILNQLGHYEAALDACDMAIAGDGSWGPLGIGHVWDQQSISHTHLGDFDTALALSNRAVGFLPAYAPAWTHQSAIHWHLGQYDAAIAASNQAIALDRTLISAWFNQALAYRSQGDYERALGAYDEIIALAPGDEHAWSNRSVILWYLERYDEAVDAADEAIARQPDSHLGWYNRGTALASLGHLQEALTAYDEALTRAPEHPDVLTGQGYVWLALGHFDEAINSLETALRVYPNHQLADTLLLEIEANQEQE
ncbi:MAG: tetratricopeptide repeat protein [Cyanobacteria bacterium J06626_14]